MVKQFPHVTGVFHCYSGSVEMARELVEMGWYLGFDGPITYKKRAKGHRSPDRHPHGTASSSRQTRPYMAPEPFRGRRNDSRYVYRMAETVAQVKDSPPKRQPPPRSRTGSGSSIFPMKMRRNQP